MLTALDAMLARFRSRARVLRALQRVAEVGDVVHRPLELTDDHSHALIGLGPELVGDRRERRRRDVPIDAGHEPRESGAGREAHGAPAEESAARAVDDWRQEAAS